MASSTKEKRKCVEQFCLITGADKDAAKKILEICKYNVEMAINMHVEAEDEVPATNDVEVASSSPVAVAEESIRPPILPVQGVLVETAAFAAGLRVRRRISRSVFDGFRDFQAEAREQEQELWNRGGTTSSHKRKTLEDLFRPPLDMMHRGSFESAREMGQYTNKWLMVNMQNVQEFQCQVLNRDVWSNQAVKSIVREHFVFWQVYHDSEEGERYMQFYSVLQWPYVAIIDPRTGENMVVWTNIDPISFCDLVSEFLTAHPSLDGSSATAAKQSSPPAKRTKSESILDASEDSQLEAAIRASLVETKSVACDSSAGSDKPNSNSNNEASTSSKCLQFSNQNSEDEDVEIETFDSDSESSSLTNAGSHSSSVTENNVMADSPSKLPENEHSTDWKQFLGADGDPKSNLIVRFPDGSKDQLGIPASSKLLALLLYVRSKGFSEEKYELVVNFPRRQLSSLDLKISLKEAGLYPQETVFVQAR